MKKQPTEYFVFGILMLISAVFSVMSVYMLIWSNSQSQALYSIKVAASSLFSFILFGLITKSFKIEDEEEGS